MPSFFFRHWVRYALAMSCVLPLTHVFATPGAVDTTYGVGGSFISTISDDARGSAIQPDGKLLLAASCPRRAPLTGKTFCVTRLATDGTLDSSFGAAGRAIFQVGDTNSIAEQALKVALQSDGKVLVGGRCASGSTTASCIARLLPNGTLDTTFGTGGKLFLPYLREFGTIRAAVGPTILVTGGCGITGIGSSPAKMCVMQFQANGTPDAAFGTSGTYEFPYLPGSSGSDVGLALAIRSDGVIAIAGRCGAAGLTTGTACVGFLNANGTPNGSAFFQSMGPVTFPDNNNTNNSLESVAWRVDGALVAAGRCTRSNSTAGVCVLYGNLAMNESVQATAAANVAPIGEDPDFFMSMVDVQVLADGRSLVFFPRKVSATSVAMSYYLYGASFNAIATDEIQPRASAPNFGWAGGAVQADGKFLIAGSCLPAAASPPNACTARFSGFPSPARQCSLDMDGDGAVTATIDGLISTRVMLGMTGSAVLNGITLPATATRTTWPLIRDHLVTQCGLVIP